jgi:hypothetical protein
MDPNLFHLDWERTFEALATIVVLSMFVERGLALLFEHRWYLSRFDQRGFKEPIAFAVAIGVCVYLKFDALAIVVLREQVTPLGMVLTAGVVAGGTKGSIKLFHDVLGWKSTAYRQARGETRSPLTVTVSGIPAKVASEPLRTAAGE